MSEMRQLCSATLSVRLWVVVTENLCILGEFGVTSHP